MNSPKYAIYELPHSAPQLLRPLSGSGKRIADGHGLKNG